MTRSGQDIKTLYVAFELGEKDWKLAMSPSLDNRPRLRSLRARATDRLLAILDQERERMGAARIEIRRRARRVKTDRLDAQKLLTMLQREALGEKNLWSVVHVPAVEDEDARSLQREYRTLVKERSRSSNRIKGLLASQGLVAPGIDPRFLEWLSTARLWDGSPVPPGVRARMEREYARWRFTHDQVLAIDKERRDRTKDLTDRNLEKVRALFALKGIGLGAAWTWGLEFFSWRNFRNGKQVGALSGLAATGGCEDWPSRSPGGGFVTSRTVSSRAGTTSASRAAVLERERSESSRSPGNFSLRSGAMWRQACFRKELC
jgi:transposase